MATPNDNLSPRGLPMMQFLPWTAFKFLRDYFYAGVTTAENRFVFNSSEEDALTGALIHCLADPSITTLEAGDGIFGFRATSHKLRGRGRGAPEKQIGADGIFQLEVFDRFGQLLVRKGLLFQSKVDWRGSDKRLLGQAERLLQESASSIVIDYTDHGYNAISASDVVSAEGNRRRVPQNADKKLSVVLGDEFVGCIRGDRGLYWDPVREVLITHGEDESEHVPSALIEFSIRQIE